MVHGRMKVFLVPLLLVLVARVGYVLAEQEDERILKYTGKSLTGQEEDAWDKTDKFSVPALEAFLARYPNAQDASDVKLRIPLLKKIAAIKAKKEKPGFVIPFEELGARWKSWRNYSNDRGMLGYYAKPLEGNVVRMGVMVTKGMRISFDEYSVPRAPTGDGSIIGFQTDGLKLKWLNGVTFVSEGDIILYFGVIESIGGLAHLQGKGKCIMPDGKEIELK